jgi:hypothetical protein
LIFSLFYSQNSLFSSFYSRGTRVKTSGACFQNDELSNEQEEVGVNYKIRTMMYCYSHGSYVAIALHVLPRLEI